MAEKADKEINKATDKSKDKLKPLRKLESICIGTALIGLGGFLTGALVDNETLSLISGGAAVLSTVAGFYSSHKEKGQSKNNSYTNSYTHHYSNTDTDNYNKK